MPDSPDVPDAPDVPQVPDGPFYQPTCDAPPDAAAGKESSLYIRVPLARFLLFVALARVATPRVADFYE